MRGNLDGVRVLDLTTEPGHFATKLLGDSGQRFRTVGWTCFAILLRFESG